MQRGVRVVCDYPIRAPRKGFSMLVTIHIYVLVSLLLLIFFVGACVAIRIFLRYTQSIMRQVSEGSSENAKE